MCLGRYSHRVELGVVSWKSPSDQVTPFRVPRGTTEESFGVPVFGFVPKDLYTPEFEVLRVLP